MTDTSETLHNYEEQFAHRFSTEDREYQEYLSRPTDPPPVVKDWRGRGGGSSRGRDNRFQDHRGHRGRGWGGGWGGDSGRAWGGEHRGQQQHWQDRDRDRQSGHGSGHQVYKQGYNYNQRPHHDRY